jgi:glucokinase
MRKADILVGDIGGTSARLAVAHVADGQQDASGRDTSAVTLSHTAVLPVAEFTSAQSLLDAYLDSNAALRDLAFAQACLALAGPVMATEADSQVTLTNAPLCFVQSELSTRLDCPVRLLHDFAAIASAIAAFSEEELTQLTRFGEAGPASGLRAIMGPGTGLGTGALVPTASGWQILPSEGGHAGLAAADPLEAEVLAVLLRTHGHVCWETVLSGPGLMRLYAAVCELWACGQEVATSAALLQAATEEADPVCHQTLELFCSLLGSAAASQVLMLGARGGLFLAGGILPRMQTFLRQSHFRSRFDEQGPLSEYCQQVPIYLLEDPWVGLRGAALCCR